MLSQKEKKAKKAKKAPTPIPAADEAAQPPPRRVPLGARGGRCAAPSAAAAGTKPRSRQRGSGHLAARAARAGSRRRQWPLAAAGTGRPRGGVTAVGRGPGLGNGGRAPAGPTERRAVGKKGSTAERRPGELPGPRGAGMRAAGRARRPSGPAESTGRTGAPSPVIAAGAEPRAGRHPAERLRLQHRCGSETSTSPQKRILCRPLGPQT